MLHITFLLCIYFKTKTENYYNKNDIKEMRKNLFDKLKLEKNDILITSYEHCMAMYNILKNDGYNYKYQHTSDNYVEDETLLNDFKEQLDIPEIYDFQNNYDKNKVVDIYLFNVDNLNKKFSVCSKRIR